MPSLYIQKISTHWYKRDRSGDDAVERNRMPEKYPVEIPDDTSDAVFLQEINYPTNDHSSPPRKLNSNQAMEERFEFQYADQGVIIRFKMEDALWKKAGSLTPNSWCQIKTNRRYSLETTWAYYKIVFNVFYGDLSKMEGTLLSKEPAFAKDYQSLLR